MYRRVHFEIVIQERVWIARGPVWSNTSKMSAFLFCGFYLLPYWLLHVRRCRNMHGLSFTATRTKSQTLIIPVLDIGSLSIDDFKAEMLPPDVQQYHESINARSCLTIRPSDNTSARIGEVSYYGSPIWVGQFRHISFEALFIPSCSWWNEKVSQKKIDYVLQHEQIHFAIAELSARRATTELGMKMKEYTAVGGTHTEVAEELNRVLLDSVHQLLESDLEIHTEFDEDTSMFFDQDRQTSWYEKLARTAGKGSRDP